METKLSSRASLDTGYRSVPILRNSLIGAFLWSLGVLGIRFGGSLGVFAPERRAILYLATALLFWAGVWLASGRRRNAPGTFALALAVMAMSATLLDGIAISWFPALYGADPAVLQPGAVWLLWGVGNGLAAGFAFDRHR